jgi:hypothetical protein
MDLASAQKMGLNDLKFKPKRFVLNPRISESTVQFLPNDSYGFEGDSASLHLPKKKKKKKKTLYC